MKTAGSSLILVIEIIAIFALGIMGNKIAEILKIESTVLLLVSLVLLVTVVVIMTMKAQAVTETKQISTTTSEAFRAASLFPVTIVGMLPIGMVVGLTFASINGLTIGQTPNTIGVFGPDLSFAIYADDLITSALGLAAVVIFAIVHKPVLSSGISIGYGIGAAPALLMTDT